MAVRRVGPFASTVPAAIIARIEIAVAHHQAGRFAVADGIYREILAGHPQYPPALHLLASSPCRPSRISSRLI
jgi:hypothetical protein